MYFPFWVDHAFIITLPDNTLSGQFEHGDVDVALLTPETTPTTLHMQQLFNEEYVCLLSETHPLAGSATLSLDEFCARIMRWFRGPLENFMGSPTRLWLQLAGPAVQRSQFAVFWCSRKFCASLIW